VEPARLLKLAESYRASEKQYEEKPPRVDEPHRSSRPGSRIRLIPESNQIRQSVAETLVSSGRPVQVRHPSHVAITGKFCYMCLPSEKIGQFRSHDHPAVRLGVAAKHC
jgi:hypothetical protein